MRSPRLVGQDCVKSLKQERLTGRQIVYLLQINWLYLMSAKPSELRAGHNGIAASIVVDGYAMGSVLPSIVGNLLQVLIGFG